ncbi:DNA helicase IV [Tamaricihabitans halophyticus]|uniref:DNA helicase IV n=2 Tax=Tamaricihabitans halophyticus TaxID=1262583 RepID=A0A4R2QJE4_9PSEU|nr:DNA helicase IV [Tamaricihabitans halophyticus]
MLYAKLDELREQATTGLSKVLGENSSNHQHQRERDISASIYSDRIAQFSAVENGLCFGRLDFQHEEHQYIGRLGLFDEQGDYEPLLMDWRAPAARPFYLATAAAPDGVRRRRHIRTRRRTVTAIDDEVLDLDIADPERRDGLAGESALLAALNASRTGQMSDIVATIQGEQDRIIRSGLTGVLVVQGGPGTGKTAVALHRAAYLLYTYREQLAKRGVLVLGPNPTFLRYIGQVLPSLGETDVLLSTIGDLYPGITARGKESVETTTLKGSTRMVEVLAAAVADRERVPSTAIEVSFDRETLLLDPQTCAQAREKARSSQRTHNEARPIFVREIVNALADQVAARLGAELLDEADLTDIRRELSESDTVQATLTWLWPLLSPEQLLTDLFRAPARIAAAMRDFPVEQRDLLLREPTAPWTPADVPLLDEAAELLGEHDPEAREREQRQQRQAIDYAQGVLDIMDLADDADPDILMATDLLDAYRLAERHERSAPHTTAERAAADRTWTFGHVIVDEAQELSAMAWRLLMRRCPSRSMTLVGDVAQTGGAAGSTSWSSALEPYVGDRWRKVELTVNYRTPSEIMAVAARLLAEINPELAAPRSVRDTGVAPWQERIDGPLADRLVECAAKEAVRIGEGTLAVIVPTEQVHAIGNRIASAVPEAAASADPDLTARVVTLSVEQSKGLEFDSVLVAEPQLILAESPRGLNDLYVALTRATQRLGVLHTEPLPPVLAEAR